MRHGCAQQLLLPLLLLLFLQGLCRVFSCEEQAEYISISQRLLLLALFLKM
jgi:hypothetical protein